MNQKKLPSLLTLTMCLELIMAPMPVFAAESIATQGLNLLNQGMNYLNKGQPAQMPPYVATDMAAFKAQQTPVNDKFFTAGKLAKIPGLKEYIAVYNSKAAAGGGKMMNPNALTCATLPTTLFESKTEVCRNKKVNELQGNPAAQADEAFLYYNQYLQIDGLYRNYLPNSNVGDSAFGVGCMNDAMTLLKSFFADRVSKLELTVAEMEALNAEFVKSSEMDLKSMRESTAVLNGENSAFGKEFRDSNIFNYNERFADAGCQSIMGKDSVNELGKGGLVKIEEKLAQDLNTKPEGSNYNAQEYLQHHGDVVRDIKKMADAISNQVKVNFSTLSKDQASYNQFLGSVKDSFNTDDTGVKNAINPQFFNDVQAKFTKTRNGLTAQMTKIRSEVGPNGQNAFDELANIDDDETFNAELTSLENNIKGECVNNSNIDTAVSRIYDPKLSKAANKHSSEQIKKRIKVIISDMRKSSETKIAEIQALESQNNSRYEMKMDAGYETQFTNADGSIGTKKVLAAGKVTPASFFTDVIRNCETQFQVNKLNNKMSGKEAINQLRNLKQDYKRAAADHARDVKKDIEEKLIECRGNSAIASSTTVGSCSPAKLSMSSSNFCAKGAYSCAQNIKSCTDKAQKYVKDIKTDRLKRSNNYNNNVEKLRKRLVHKFDTDFDKAIKEANLLNGMFGVGFKIPAGIERDIAGDAKFDQKFLGNEGDALEVKDPAKYLEMVKKNITALKNEMLTQQEGVTEALDKHIQETEKNYKTQVLAKASQMANDCLAAYDSYKDLIGGKAKQANDEKLAKDKMLGELGEKKIAFCSAYSDIMVDHIIASCDDDVGELANDVSKAAEKVGDRATSAEANAMRREMKMYCSEYGNQRTKDGASTLTAEQACVDKTNDLKLKEALDKVAKEYKFTDSTELCLAIASANDNKKWSPSDVGTKETPKVSWSCDSYKGYLTAAYMNYKGVKSSKTTDADSSQAGGDLGSFCNSSNNSGHWNTKGTAGEKKPEIAGQKGSTF